MALPTEYAFVNPTSMPEQAETEMFVAVHTSEPAHLASEPPAVETAAPAATTKEAEAKVTAALEIDQRPKDEVVIEEGADGSSGKKPLSEMSGHDRCETTGRIWSIKADEDFDLTLAVASLGSFVIFLAPNSFWQNLGSSCWRHEEDKK